MYKIATFLFSLLAVATSFQANATVYGSDPTLPRTAGLPIANGFQFVNVSDGVSAPGYVYQLEAFNTTVGGGISYAVIYTPDISIPGNYKVTGTSAMSFTGVGYKSFLNPTFTGSSAVAIGSVFGLWQPTGGAAIALDALAGGTPPAYDTWFRSGSATGTLPGIGSSFPFSAPATAGRNYSFQVSVPEPSALLLVSFALAGWASVRRKRSTVVA